MSLRSGATILLSVALLLSSAPREAAAAQGTVVYLPNIVKMLGGADGWQTPFIVQNVGSVATDLRLDFYSFGGALVKTRIVSALAAGTSIFHDPNSDPELAAGGQYSVVITSTSAPVVSVVNEHQNARNQAIQEALSYTGLSRGSTRVFLPYVSYNVGGWLTTFIIQNLGTTTANVSAKFVSFDGTKTITLTRTIASGRSQFVDPRIETTLTAGTEYAVSITSDQAVGVVVNAHNDLPGTLAPMGFSYNGVLPAEDLNTFVPYATKNPGGNGRWSRLIVQNMGQTSATPTLYFRRLGETLATQSPAPAPLQPGAALTYDMRLSALVDGEYSIHIGGGQFAVVNATVSAATAMGYTNYTGNSTVFYLPNITRRLGGSDGWTTPIIVQAVSTVVSTARLLWYRFSDGVLVATQQLNGLSYATSLRVDPRDVPGLEDNTQYAVVVETPAGGAAVVVTELNFQGGDGAMVYEGFEPAPPSAFGTSNCIPESAPAGSTFICHFYGLPPGANPITLSRTTPSGPLTPTTFTSTVPIDGSWTLYLTTATVGMQTLTATAGGRSIGPVSFTVTLPEFAVAITQTRNGFLAAQTKAGIPCVAQTNPPTGSGASAALLPGTMYADAGGNVQWTYPQLTTPTGTWSHSVRCTNGRQTLTATSGFTVP